MLQIHQGQTDKAGQPYILHPLRVMFSRKNETKRICAVLHDVIKDTDITLEYMRNEGFSEEVLSALDSLEEADEDFIMTKEIEIDGCVTVPESCSF